MILLKFTAYWDFTAPLRMADELVKPSPPPPRVSDVARVSKISIGDQSSRNKRRRMPNRTVGPLLRSAHPSREDVADPQSVDLSHVSYYHGQIPYERPSPDPSG